MRCLPLACQASTTGSTVAKDCDKWIAACAAFEAGRKGSSTAVAAAREPDNALYLAYAGSTRTLEARDSSLPWSKLRLVKQGMELLDHALARVRASEAHRGALPSDSPQSDLSLETRLVAVATFIALPDALFHRKAAVKQILREALENPSFAQANPGIRGHLYYEGALIARQEGDTAAERTALERALALNASNVELAELRSCLAQLR